MQRNKLDNILRVENNLHSPIELAGESGKNILARMLAFNVQDVSITVFNGNELWSRTYSQTSNHQIEEVALYQAASISKTITAVLAVKLLVLTGKMQLDDEVNGFLKAWKIPGDNYKEKVTLRRLLSHTAGLNVGGFSGYPSTHHDYPTTTEVLRGNEALRNKSPDEIEAIIAELPEGNVNSPPVEVQTEPGSEMIYSGGGTMVIQQLLEEVMGKPFHKIAYDHVFKPLHMEASTFQLKFPSAAREAKQAYTAEGTKIATGWNMYPESAAAGLWTTPQDLATFFMAISEAYRGESELLLPADMARQMLVRQPLSEFGLGFNVYDFENELAFGHPGGNRGYNCEAIIFPNRQAGVIVMTNSDQGFRLIKELMCSVFATYGWPGKTYQQKHIVPLDMALMMRCAGEFTLRHKNEHGKMIVSVEKGTLYISIPHPNLTSETRRRIAFLPESPSVFFSVAENVQVTFSENYQVLSFGPHQARRESALTGTSRNSI